MTPSRRLPAPALTRSAAAVLLLASEYIALFLLLAQLYDGAEIAALPPSWNAAMWGATYALGGVILGLCAAVVLWRARIAGEIARLAAAGQGGRGWLALHFLCYLALAGLSALALGRPDIAARGGFALLGLWALSGAGVVLTPFLAIFGSRLLGLGRRLGGVLAASALIGAGTGLLLPWLVGSWTLLSRPTLLLASFLLGAMGQAPLVVLDQHMIVVGDFAVKVSSVCSGIEGIGLVALFLGGHLYCARDEYRFPRALLVLPLAMLLSFLANAARIALLVLIGAHVSPEIASGAFHSMAGWIFFCLLTIGLAALCQRLAWLRRKPWARAAAARAADPTSAYLLPFLAWLALGLLGAAFAQGPSPLYPVQVLAAAGLLLLYRGAYAQTPGAEASGARASGTRAKAEGWGLRLAPWAIGAAIFLGWLALAPAAPARSFAEVAAETGWPRGLFLVWIAFRLAGTILVVPIIEELAFRGYLQRRISAADFTAVPLGAWHWPAVLGSATVFGLLHGAWAAGILSGIALSAAVALRGRLRDAIIAHGVANLLLSASVLGLGRWYLW